uniref:Uncharacterized protein n=1 Tax=Anguilla anguilla TaxID=7936 RepID=A0A0E9RXC8_ANGAN
MHIRKVSEGISVLMRHLHTTAFS